MNDEDEKKDLTEEKEAFEKMIKEEMEKIKKVESKKFFSKVYHSIFKLEEYPDIGVEGLKSAFKYLTLLTLLLVAITSVAMMIELRKETLDVARYLEEEFPEATYQNGKLHVESENEVYIQSQDGRIKVIANTNEITQIQMKEYMDKIQKSEVGILLLENEVRINQNGLSNNISTIDYKTLFMQDTQITINKSELIQFLRSPKMYLSYILIYILVVVFGLALKLIGTLMYIVIISISGTLAGRIIGLRLRYLSVFSLAIYSITLSTILNTVYGILNMHTGFKIEHFDIMYIGVATIYVVAAVFMIKAELIKRQTDLKEVFEVHSKLVKRLDEQSQNTDTKNDKSDGDEIAKSKEQKNEDEEGEQNE